MGNRSSAQPAQDPASIESLGQEVADLVRSSFEGIDPAQVLDSHVHIAGIGKGDTGCFVNEKMLRCCHLYHHIKLKVFMGASGVSLSDADADLKYASLLAQKLRGLKPLESKTHGKALILAFDQTYATDGTAQPELTGFHVPNEYVEKLVNQYPNEFVMACSVHPYRTDALRELERWAAKGVRVVKWLPNSMNIDPADDRCVPFYRKLTELNMVLLCHTGQEHSVDAGFHDDDFGNPLKLRRALDLGTRVIAAHCATEGQCSDLDNPTTPDGQSYPKRDNFDLWLRLMDEPKYANLLYGDISAITAFKRAHYIERLLDRTDLHPRLLFGSDFPVPAVRVVVWTRRLVSYGLITSKERSLLDAIWSVNPVLFDFVCKRCLRSKKGNRFADSIFQVHPILQSAQASSTATATTAAESKSSPAAASPAVACLVPAPVDARSEIEPSSSSSVVTDAAAAPRRKYRLLA